MNKSILVIDTPESCEKCRFCSFGSYGAKRCAAVDQAIFLKKEELKPNWCPLRDIPAKMDIDRERQVSIREDCYDDESDEAYLQGNVRGWNACIDKLIDDQKEEPA